jgi:glycerol-3-phosphate acyltransferase PlsX
MRVAVDVMGGDHGPDVVIPGSLTVLDDPQFSELHLLLVGPEAAIANYLTALPASNRSRISVIDAPDEVTMHDAPAMAVRRKPKSSIAVALKSMKAGDADAVMSAGNSGAVMAGAIAVNGRVLGVERPALSTILPTFTGRTILLDLGAITDPKPEYLVQFAIMADTYMKHVMGISAPKVALLSNGEESSKGNDLVQEVHALLLKTPIIDFHGNVEGNRLLRGDYEIVVTDGFTGNVALKSMEGAISVLTDVMREELTRTLPRKAMAALMRPSLRAIRDRLSYEEIGGAPLLGVNGAVSVAHGRSRERAIANAVRVAHRTATQQIPEMIGQAIRASGTGRYLNET